MKAFVPYLGSVRNGFRFDKCSNPTLTIRGQLAGESFTEFL